ncbi:MAG: hypothetical protein QOG72_2448 [Sphingomonadales bacterium]|jgi:hypothetical protein|nr:hypothetical protein [Sphingomonadales bacterium]
MRSAPTRRARGQVAATAAAGAPASTFPAPTRRRDARVRAALFFASPTRDPNPLISFRWRGSAVCLPSVTLLLGVVTAGVAAKSLFLQGFKGVLPCYSQGAALHMRAHACARAPYPLSPSSNIGNMSLYLCSTMTWPFPALLLRPSPAGNTVTASAGAFRCPIKIGCGYSLDRRQSADLHPFGGSAGEKFRGRIRPGREWRISAVFRGGARGRPFGGSAGEKFRGRRAWAGSRPAAMGSAELAGLAGSGLGGNGGFPPFFEGARGAVGTVALERSVQGADIARFSGPARKLAQLTSLGLAAGPGADRGRRGGTPPIAAAPLPGMLAQTFARIWIEDRAAARPAPPDRVQDGSEGSLAQMGLGVSDSRRARKPRSGEPRRSGSVVRVGDGRSSVGRPDEFSRLWAGGGDVNA